MNLSSELVSQFVKATKDNTKTSSESIVYGTTVEYGGKMYVKLDGSDLLTPVSKTTDVKDDERVTVLIKDHTATITGNMSSPAARTDDVQTLGNRITEAEILVAQKVSTEQLEAQSARIDELVSDNVYVKEKLTANEAEIDTLVADNATINEKLTANEASIKKLDAEKLSANAADIKYASIESLEAIEGEFHTLESTYGDFQELTTKNFEAINAEIDNIDAKYITADELNAEYAKVKDLEAEQARIDILEATSLTANSAEIKNLQADVADIDTLIFGSASGTTIQTSFANAIIAQLGNAQIKSAMIENISADKINAGDINTNNVRVVSDDGRLVISDETIQISDAARVRVQIGKDAAGDYSINVWDAEGNLMFSEGGITDAAIKDAIIRNDMVAADANIAASKLDISSLFTEINNSTETINAGRVYVDTEKQTLDVVFTQMSSDIDGINQNVSSQGTQISAIQGQITSRVWQQDIETAADELGREIETLNTKQSSIEQTVNGLTVTVSEQATEIANKADSSTVTNVSAKVTKLETDLNGLSVTISEHETDIANKADGSTVTAINNKVTELETDLDGFRSSVSSTYATKTELAATDTKATNAQSSINTLTTRITSAETAITQSQEEIALRATKTELSTVESIANEAASEASDAKNSVDDLSVRMVSAESEIAQNSEQIALMVTRNEVTETLDGYYTKNETESAISAKTDEINLSVSEVREEVENLNIGGRNLIAGTSLDTEYSGSKGSNDYKDIWAAKTIDIPTAAEYVVSFDAKADTAQTIRCYFCSPNTTTFSESCTGYTSNSPDGQSLVNITTEWKRYWVKWKQTAADAVKSVIVGRTDTDNTVYIRAVKLEVGNKTTDWTPAPEDMATADDLNTTKENIQAIQETVATLSVESDEIKANVENVESAINNITGELEVTKNEVASMKLESDELKIGFQNITNNGVSKVTTETGFTFDRDGMTVDSTGSPTKTQVTTDGMTVYRKDTGGAETEVLAATSEGVDATNLHAKTYLIIGGRSRFENYGTNRTGCFWIGG